MTTDQRYHEVHYGSPPGVHVGRGLVDHQDAVLSQYGSGQTHQLPLAHAEVAARLGQNRLQLPRQLLHHRLQLHLEYSESVFE